MCKLHQVYFLSKLFYVCNMCMEYILGIHTLNIYYEYI